ncbi:MAG: glycosyltransferase family 4 protein [Gemmatimonadetes bacterium]|nr:glycosyltransferase family 4 protein [Gemmatimonadota bacterium]
MRVLFISYDGLLEPLGRSQVLPYFRALAGRGHEIEILSFEKPADLRAGAQGALHAELAGSGIGWTALRYHKRPTAPATAWDICAGSAAALGRAWRRRFDLVHGRSYVGGLMALAVKRCAGLPFVFEMRGFWVDERVDGGLWRADGVLARVARRAERSLFYGADAVLVSSRAGIERIRATPERFTTGGELVLVRTAVDVEVFAPRPRDDELARRTGLSGRFVLAYSGSVGTWYLLGDMLRFFAALRRLRADARLLILTRGSEAMVRGAAAEQGLPDEAVVIRAVDAADVPRWLALADAGIVFVKALPSKAASSPIKLSEFLASGLPVVLNAGVADTGELVGRVGAGIVLNGLDEASLAEGAARLLAADHEAMRRAARRLAEQEFSLEAAVTVYERTYARLTARNAA